MAVVADLSEEERFLLAILMDGSGVDIAEFCWVDDREKDGIFRCYDYQYQWYRDTTKFQIDQCGRSVGKSTGIQLRSFAFPYSNPGEEMLVTAPEMIHLDPVTKAIEDRIMSVRLGREMLKRSATSNGITHRPFEARFLNGARIVGRIPQKDGRGVKGMHPKKLEMDEAQDYPEPGWIELFETLKYGNDEATWRAHGVSRGVRDRYYKQTQPNSGWTVHVVTAMHRGDWTQGEREAKAEMYGSRDHPDYRRNILGKHGDAQSALFVLTRLMACVDSRPDSPYNQREYHHVRISNERLSDSGMPIEALLDFPAGHQVYQRVWVGMDVGMTNHPSEILIFAEEERQSHTGGRKATDGPEARLKLITRIHLERISAPDQRAVLEQIYEWYRPKAIAMDRTGLGLPIFQEIIHGDNPGLANTMRGYNFSEKIVIGFEPADEDDPYQEPEEIRANVLEYSSDMLRLLVDREQILLPWDIDLVREFQGQTYQVTRNATNPYGKKQFNQGKFHSLDAARMSTLAYFQELVEKVMQVDAGEVVLDSFLL